jgi:hypothetical protein
MASPATPILTADQYRDILDTLDRNPTAANEATRTEIREYLSSRDAWTADAERRNTRTPY